MKKFSVLILSFIMLAGSVFPTYAAGIKEIVVMPRVQNLSAWSEFSEGLCAVSDGEKYGFINTKGKLVIPVQYSLNNFHDKTSLFSEGLAMVVINNKICYMDKTGKIVLKTSYPYNRERYKWAYDGGGAFHEGLAAVTGANGKWGYINKQGKVVLPFQYAGAHPFKNGWAAIAIGEGFNQIDKKGNKLYEEEYLIMHEKPGGGYYASKDVTEAALSVRAITYDVLDENGKVLERNLPAGPINEIINASDEPSVIEQFGLDANRYFYAQEPTDGIIMATLTSAVSKKYNNNVYVYVNATTKKEIYAPVQHGYKFNEGLAFIRNEKSRWGAIDTKGKVVIPFNYLYVDHFEGFSEGYIALTRVSDGALVVIANPLNVIKQK
jgi:hypothetical protein